MILNALGALVAMLATLQGSNAATPTGGSPSGFAMRLQGKGDIAVPVTKFSAGTAGSFPTDATGHTWTMWVKAYHPLGGGKRMFLLGEAETFLYSPFLNFKGQTADGVPISAFIDETGTPGGNLGKSYAELFDTWTHLAYSVDIGTGTDGKNVVKTYVNGVLKTSSEMSEKVGFDEFPGFAVGGYVGFGQEFPNLNIVQDHFNGLMDEIAIYKKVLTATEIANSMNKKLTGSETDLVMYWDFDDMADYTAGEVDNKASAGGAQYNLKLGQSYGRTYRLSAPSADSCRFDDTLPHHHCDQMTKPKFVPAAIPGFTSTTASDYVATAFYAKVGGSNVEFELPGADLDDANAALTYTKSTDVSEGTLALTGNKVTFTPPASSSNPSTSFAYTVTSGGIVSAPTVVTIYYVSAPTAYDVSSSPFEDTAGEIIMESYDELGLLSSFEITSLPTEGTLSSVDGTGAVIAEITTVPTEVTTNRLKFLPDKDKTSERTFTYKATNGFASSAEATVTISIISADDIPDPVDGDEEAASTGRLELDLSCGKACDPDSNFTTVIIEELPINGKLYLDSGTTNDLVEKFDPFFVPPMESQYVNKILEQSTQYRTGNGKWSGLAIVGPPDAPLVYGDSGFANCFMDKAAPNKLDPIRCGVSISTGTDATGNLGAKFDPDGTTYGGHYFGEPGLGLAGYDDIQHECSLNKAGCASHDIGNTISTECWNAQDNFDSYGWSQFFTVQFVNQVYIKSLKFGINRGAGSVWSIEAYDRASGKWQTIYKADEITNDQATFDKTTNQYNTWRPFPLCEPSFKTDIIKVKVDTITVDDWNEFDYIELTGSQMQTPGVISSGKVHYEAGSGSDAASCVDNFKYSATDCGGSVTRTSPTSQYNIKPYGAAASLPNCATPVTVAVTDISTTFAPTVFNADHLNTTYAFEAIPAETNGKNTWTYDKFANAFTFDWSNTDSDKTSYDVKYNVMTQGTTTVVAIQTITFTIDEKYVRLTADIAWGDKPTCTNSNELEIKYHWAKDSDGNTLKPGAIAGKSLPPDTTEKCADVPAGSGAGALVIVIAVAGFVVCLIFVVFMIVKKTHPVIKSSQPLFCIVYGLGCAFICLQMVFYLGEATNFTCGMRYWLFNIIFTLSFGSLFAKTWRVWRVFSNTHLKKIRLTNMDTLRVMFLLLLMEVILLALGQIMAPFEPQDIEVEFEPGRFLSVKECGARDGKTEWALLTMAWKVILVLIGCYLSWTTRNVDSAFAESKYIMLAIYQVAIYGTVAAIVNGSGSNVEMTLLVQTFCCVFGAIFCVASVLAPKILLISSGQYDDGFKSGSQGTSLNTGGSTGGNSEELERLEDEISRLKALLKENNIEG